MRTGAVVAVAISLAAGFGVRACRAADAPRSGDGRLVMELFAQQPQVVTPTGIDVDARGRVFVAESHTHFRPEDYQGPEKDRILVFEDTDGDGLADRRTVFHEGFTYVMDVEWGRDGWLYVATRMDIHRMRDNDGDLRADEVQPVVKMETTGTYPHNGLSGLAFTFDDWLQFGLGENLGHDYTLVGSDGTRISGGGEGGSTYVVRPDGTGLRRVTTGWWNPWGMCVDAFGRVFGTDNDPGASPPCRLNQVVERGDYGYEYRYGRTGLHPLVTWTGEITGTLPMVAGTGEAPCAVVAYESDALPAEYRGDLLVASWADHRVEHYRLKQRNEAGLVETRRQVLFEGGNEFRPVGLAIAPDGTVYVSDWVSSSYTLHGLGRIWRIRPREMPQAKRPAEAKAGLHSADRRTRERAARELAASDAGRGVLRKAMLESGDARGRAVALQALAAAGDERADFAAVARGDAVIAVRVLAVRELLRRGGDAARWARPGLPAAVRVEAIARLDPGRDAGLVHAALGSADPAVYHAGVDALSRHAAGEPGLLEQFAELHTVAALLAAKRNAKLRASAAAGLGSYLADGNDDVRYTAVKWIADDRLVQYRAAVKALLDEPGLSYRLLLAASAALDRLDGKEPADRPSGKLLLGKIADPSAAPSVRALCLRLIDPGYGPLKVKLLESLARAEDAELRLEAVRTLANHRDARRLDALSAVASDADEDLRVRAAAVAGLAAVAEGHRALLLKLAAESPAAVRDEALRGLVGVELIRQEREALKALAGREPGSLEAVLRLLNGKAGSRPEAADTGAWLRLALEAGGDPAAGERIFFGTKVGTCSKCHQYDGRGNAVGPPLTQISKRVAAQGQAGRRWLLETILEPSQEMAPQYSTWIVVTKDGRTLTGLPRRKGGNQEAYLGVDGKEFVVKKEEIAMHAESGKSLMPEGLLQGLTVQELRDLFAFLVAQNR